MGLRTSNDWVAKNNLRADIKARKVIAGSRWQGGYQETSGKIRNCSGKK